MLPSLADAPFHCPPDVVIDLPYPPSVNRLWRNSGADATSRVYLSPSYVKWKQAADILLLSTKGWRNKKIAGSFVADIVLCPPQKGMRGDIDNRIKAVLDFLQRIEVVANDKHCQRVSAEWVDAARAPTGCRVTVRACA